MTFTMEMRLPSAWTDQRIELLKKLWDDGLSCRQIAASFDWAFSRNAIIGKARRLGLTPRFTAKGGRPRMHPIDPISRQRPPKQFTPSPSSPPLIRSASRLNQAAFPCSN